MTEFVGSAPALADTYADAEGVVIEASGMANPRVVQRMLEETGLDATYALTRIVTVVDPTTFLKLIHTLPNVQDQVRAADTVLINKADLVADDAREAARAIVWNLNPDAQILHCVCADVELDVFAPADSGRASEGEYAACRDPNYETCWVKDPGTLTGDQWVALLERHADITYRAKGFVQTPDGEWLYVELAGDGASWRPAREAMTEAGLAIIGRPGVSERVVPDADASARP